MVWIQDEVLFAVFLLLSAEEILTSAQLVCKKWKSMLEDSRIWKPFIDKLKLPKFIMDSTPNDVIKYTRKCFIMLNKYPVVLSTNGPASRLVRVLLLGETNIELVMPRRSGKLEIALDVILNQLATIPKIKIGLLIGRKSSMIESKFTRFSVYPGLSVNTTKNDKAMIFRINNGSVLIVSNLMRELGKCDIYYTYEMPLEIIPQPSIQIYTPFVSHVLKANSTVLSYGRKCFMVMENSYYKCIKKNVDGNSRCSVCNLEETTHKYAELLCD